MIRNTLRIARARSTTPSLQTRNRLSNDAPISSPVGSRNHFTTLVATPWSSLISQNSRNCLSLDPTPLFQVRWKRHDGNKAFARERPPTKKQRKAYNRDKQKIQAKSDRHSRPGLKAGPAREFVEERIQELIDDRFQNDGSDDALLLEYNADDALLDDLIGNSQYSVSLPTPEPVYLGHRHLQLFNRVADKMDAYNDKLLLLKEKDNNNSNNTGAELVTVSEEDLPTDLEISLALRSFRDLKGTRQNPVGLVKALQHLLQDLGLSISMFGELTFTSLLTCSLTPSEGRKVMQIMKEQRHPVSEYSWSILVDIHSKVGDYQGCLQVMNEMLEDGVPPTLPAYTSFFAACYKVCNDKRVAHAVRAEAAKKAFETWQDMRIVGVTPDAMAYGAILRVCAAQGKPEKALNYLEEMQQLAVKPTALCFSSALRAVARSHATAIRYERGDSRRNLQREFLTKHHGKLTRAIVMKAEEAEVEQDSGFVAALIMCAATAGDLATAKAIYTASQIRRFDELRTIGPDSHLARLRGEFLPDDENDLLSLTQGGTAVDSAEGNMLVERKSRNKVPSFGEREYGKDSRVFTSLLHACAMATDQNGMGTIWQGRENNGYLCENSLRLINSRRLPRYRESRIPGQGRLDAVTWDGETKIDDYRDGKRKPRKFTGFKEVEHVPRTLDELDEDSEHLFMDEDGELKKEFRRSQPEDIWRMKYGESPEESLQRHYDEMDTIVDTEDLKLVASEEATAEPETMTEELYFDKDERKWKTRMVPKTDPKVGPVVVVENKKGPIHHKHESSMPGTSFPTEDNNEELYFDTDERKWKTRPRHSHQTPQFTSFEEKRLVSISDEESKSTTVADEQAFQLFFEDLQLEMSKYDLGGESLEEEEARELFTMLKAEYNDEIELARNASPNSSNDPNEIGAAALNEARHVRTSAVTRGAQAPSTVWNGAQVKPVSMTAGNARTVTLEPDSLFERQSSQASREADAHTMTGSLVDMLSSDPTDEYSSEGSDDDLTFSFDEDEEEEEIIPDYDHQMEILRDVLPAFSERRLMRILRVFRKSLSDPSLLELVAVVRERMPDYVTSTWLKQMSSLTAKFVIQEAEHEGIVDLHMANSVLELETCMGSLDRAIEFHQSEFDRLGMSPNEFSDRIVVQMLLKSNRLSRALVFKSKIEDDGRKLDLHSYGSLIDFCSSRGQLGSSLLLLDECLAVHDAQPSEASLAKLRVLCRNAGMEDEIGLEKKIGVDPIKWLRHGEANLKREMSKAGRRDVQFVRNRLVHL